MPFRVPKLKFRLMKRNQTPIIQAAKISVQGQAHIEDSIPNQDAAFHIVKPPTSTKSRRSKKGETGQQLHTFGIYATGVFDGHGPKGELASVLAAERMSDALHRIFSEEPDVDLEKAVEQAFSEVAATLNSAKCGEESGTTGSIAVIRDNDLVLAHVGDSAIVLVSTGQFQKGRVKYTSPLHRPCEEREAIRIKEHGGCVIPGYVMDPAAKNGLAVTRTLGDRDMQVYGCISKPHIQSFKLKKEDCAVLVASDGFWDHEGLEMEKVIQMAARCKRETPKLLCEQLMEMAYLHGQPTDDCTIACLTMTSTDRRPR